VSARFELDFADRVCPSCNGDLARLAELRRTESPRVLDELKEWLGNQITQACCIG
jgi:hypothetical protein